MVDFARRFADKNRGIVESARSNARGMKFRACEIRTLARDRNVVLSRATRSDKKKEKKEVGTFINFVQSRTIFTLKVFTLLRKESKEH